MEVRPVRSFRRLHQVTPRVKALNGDVEALVRRRVEEGAKLDPARQLLLDEQDAMSDVSPRLAVILGEVAVEQRVSSRPKREIGNRRLELAAVKLALDAEHNFRVNVP